jgi:hypothetical protein
LPQAARGRNIAKSRGRTTGGEPIGTRMWLDSTALER